MNKHNESMREETCVATASGWQERYSNSDVALI
jgi:hypothetical protein